MNAVVLGGALASALTSGSESHRPAAASAAAARTRATICGARPRRRPRRVCCVRARRPAVRIAAWLVDRTPGAPQYAEFYAILAAAICVAGHSFPVWLGFRGGKGVATSAGALFGIMPVAIILIFLLWAAVFWTSGYVSLASIAGAVALPVVVAVMVWLNYTQGAVLFYFSLAMAALVVWRHRSNISRLLNGTEQRFARK